MVLLESKKSLEDSGVLIDGISDIVTHEIKIQEGRVFSMLLGSLGSSMLRNMLSGKSYESRWGYNNMDQIDKNF